MSGQLKSFEQLEKQHPENPGKIDAKGVREKLKEPDTEQAPEEAGLAGQHKAGLMAEGTCQEALLNLQKE
jgi:hypothetical protein